ncbi:hypothetical protein E2C01_051804 [Portunus trituberculatus]|uniref:Uncharacterized protein n=1 Tax=Portunus trituberculatus TaxID=210409 RepID=A0A5B7GJU4_PORTR|nr:hypothetical protein [Portunus trituberculatus]
MDDKKREEGVYVRRKRIKEKRDGSRELVPVVVGGEGRPVGESRTGGVVVEWRGISLRGGGVEVGREEATRPSAPPFLHPALTYITTTVTRLPPQHTTLSRRTLSPPTPTAGIPLDTSPAFVLPCPLPQHRKATSPPPVTTTSFVIVHDIPWSLNTTPTLPALPPPPLPPPHSGRAAVEGAAGDTCGEDERMSR